jgi:hypothetical protein
VWDPADLRKGRRKEVGRFASLPEATSHSFFSFWSEVACDTVIKLWVLVQVHKMAIDSTESGATAMDNCERAFGLIRASWATASQQSPPATQTTRLPFWKPSSAASPASNRSTLQLLPMVMSERFAAMTTRLKDKRGGGGRRREEGPPLPPPAGRPVGASGPRRALTGLAPRL